jgi:isopenicillin-N N-acyltransferase-like protein
MTTTHPTIPVLDLAGTPGQIGAAHGESQRERIREYVNVFLDFIVKHACVAVTEETLWSRWSQQVAANQRYAPTLVEEMQGIARGAGVPFERIFLLNSLLDLNSFRYLDMAVNFAGCSTFAVVSEAGTGKALIGQTYDMPEFHEKYCTLLRLKPNQGPRQLVFTFAGIVGCAGQNEHGIAVNINYLSANDGRFGRLHSVIVRQILAQKALADALTPPVCAPRAGGAHYLIGDQHGNLNSIETTGEKHAIFYPEGNAIGHTNHYLSPRLQEVENIRPLSIGSSLARYTALRRFLREKGDSLTVDGLKELTRNHTSYPRSICAHGADFEPAGTKGRTVSAMVQIPVDHMMHITQGCACENAYHAVTL